MDQAATAIPAIDARQFRSALGSFATGVTIVTTRAGEGLDVGLTANSFNSVSLDPPMVLWSLAKNAASLPVFMASEYFAVHVLASDQQSLSDRFARRGIDKFEGVDVQRGRGGIPLLPGCSARFQCRTTFRYEGGDHIIFVGSVLDFEHADKAPLLFHGGGYGKILPRPKVPDRQAPEVESSFRKDFLGYLLGVANARILRSVHARWSALGLTETQYYVVTVLAARHAVSVQQLESVLAAGNRRLDAGDVPALVNRGFVRVDGDAADASVELTTEGRRQAIELFAIAKAAEEEAVAGFDADEARLLKQLLKRVIRNTLERDASATEQ
jgi:3-hydroxy-9,10-secoandrosta-1,3,5(10)-triene-9,17-dione monooxygenase reductase component